MLTSAPSPVFSALKEFLKERAQLLELIPHGTSSFHETYKAVTSEGAFFVKANRNIASAKMFAAEADGLKLLKSTACIGIPEVRLKGNSFGYQFLLLEFIESGKRISEYHTELGASLAQMHMNRSVNFGLDHDNYSGTLPQSNRQETSGSTFLAEARWRPLIKSAALKGLMPFSLQHQFEKLITKLQEILPDEQASLIHGDLWNGNCVTGQDGKAWLIDPAAHYGFRESELAMMKLFGGFDASCYLAYLNTFPLVAGWEERISLFQIYPLLVHLNLFGSGYLPAIHDAVNDYI